MKTMKAICRTIQQYYVQPMQHGIRKLVLAGLVALSLFNLSEAFISSAAHAAALPHRKSTVYVGTPNRYHPPATPDRSGPYPGPAHHLQKAPNRNLDTRLVRHYKPAMPPMHLALTQLVGTGSQATPSAIAIDATSTDGSLEIKIPANSLTRSAILAAGGAVYLQVDQVAPGSGSTSIAASSGLITFGTYTFQLEDAAGHELKSGQGLSQPITFIQHWKGVTAPVDLTTAPLYFIINGALPAYLPHPLQHLGKPQVSRATFNAAQKTITAILPMTSSGGGATTATPSPVGYFAKPNAFQNDLHTGSLSDSISIDVPSGPGGLTPPLNLSYSSESVTQSHGAQATASWVGMGWSLDPGEISWSETNVAAPGLTATWGNSWNISDPFGTSGSLIPQNTSVNPWYSDLSTSLTAEPLTWHTNPESFARIVSFSRSGSMPTHWPSGFAAPPCFRAWLTDGDMEEFGCSGDSLQWYMAGTSTKYPYISAWKLDLITDPSGNQIQFTYAQDAQTDGSYYDIRDLVLSTVQWDSPACHNANTLCTGSSWAPLMQVSFSIASNHQPRLAPGQTACTYPNSSRTYLRCDDPMLPNGITGIDTPTITNTEVLNDIIVQVRTSGTGSWNTLRDYQLAYGQGALSPSYIIEPIGGQDEAAAGYLLLEQVTEIGADGATKEPTQSFTYSIPSTQYYVDSNYTPNAGAGCGPNWNTGVIANGTSPKGCLLWFRSYNGFYMATADNGMGLHQTFSWTNMQSNTHGVQSGQDPSDPSICTQDQASEGANTNYPCDMADDNTWSHITLTQRTAVINTPLSNNPSKQEASQWSYRYNLTHYTAQMCGDCAYGMYWGNANDGNEQGFYDGKFVGFNYASVVNPDGSFEGDYYYTADGWGVWDNTQVSCINALQPSPSCPNSPSWDLANAATGHAYQVNSYNPKVNGVYPLQKQVLTTWAAVCPPPHVAGSGSNGHFSWAGNLVSEVDADNPEAACDVRQASQQTYLADGNNSPSGSTTPYSLVSNSYDDANTYGHLIQSTTTGNDLGLTPTIVKNTTFIWHDAITTSSTSASGTYIVDTPAFQDVEDGSGHQQSCTYTLYDGASSYSSGSQSSLTRGLATQSDTYATCPSSWTTTNVIATSKSYNSNGDPINSIDADGNAGISGHKATTGSCTGYTSCTTYDSTYGVLPASQTNAFNQRTTTTYTTTQAFGFGLWPASTTDANNQTTSMTYDALGRTIDTIKPGDSQSSPTTVMAYSFSACTSSPNAPCLEVDTTQRLNSTTTVKTEDFYDGFGRHAETVKPGPGGQDVVQYFQYDFMGYLAFQSQPYFVTAASGYITPDVTQPGTSYHYDGLGRITQTTDPLSATTTTSYSAACNATGLNDSSCYEETTTVDANQHQHTSFADAIGQVFYNQDWTGTGPYTSYRVIRQQYDYLGDLINTRYADGSHAATATYNAMKEETSASDPDLGSMSYQYDPNGNQTQATMPDGTVYTCYDGLNRVTGKSFSSSTCGSPYATYSYDSTSGGNDGVGRLTGETFASGPNQAITGSYAYTYDARGQQIGWIMTIGGTSYPFSMTYNDNGQQTTVKYPDGDTLTTSYDGNGWYSGSSSSTSGSLFSGATYGANPAGASQQIYQANLGSTGVLLENSYDNDLRLTEANYVKPNQFHVLITQYSDTRGYDAVGNVVTDATNLVATGTDNQAFCYDEQNRLTWAGSTGTPPCQSLTAGTLTSAFYTQSYAYDTLDRLTSGPNGTSTYGDSNHLDAVTSTTGGYTARYSAGGAMTCRAPTSSLTCTGTPTGQPLTYDALERQLSWQNQATSPTTTASYGYDGAGSRVEQQVTSSGTTTTTYYIGSYEEVSVTGSTTTTTKYYATKAGTAVAVNGTVSYLLTNGLSSVTVALSSLGNITATQLFTPYGNVRYSSGTMPTSKGFTGQRLDGSGLNYFNARYYDSGVGQFTSADTVQGLNRYAYTGGNPETRTDPSGNCFLVCAVIGAAVGFVGDLAVQEVSSIASGNGFTTHPDWGQALTWGAAGAIIGGTGGAAFFADSLLISTSVPVLGGIDAASTTAVGASAAYGGFANSATQFVIGLSNGLGYTKSLSE